MYFLLICLPLSNAFAQVTFWQWDSPQLEVSENSQRRSLKTPWVGGLQAPQFAHLNLTGRLNPELVVYDRACNSTMVFEWNGIDWLPRLDLAISLPKLNYWFQVGDWNADGRQDLFTHSTKSQTAIAIYTNVAGSSNVPEWRLQTDTLHYSNPTGLRQVLSFNPADLPSVGDFDNDGDADILLVKFGALTLNLIRSNAVEANNRSQLDYYEVSRCAGQIATSSNCNQYSAAIYP